MSYKLLIVDDSMVIRNRIARLCQDKRLPNLNIVGLAGNGIRAVGLAREFQPELVTMDLTMPQMDGSTCIGMLSEIVPEARILVVSALSDKYTLLKAIRRGAQGFLHKPFTDDQLVEAFLELL